MAEVFDHVTQDRGVISASPGARIGEISEELLLHQNPLVSVKRVRVDGKLMAIKLLKLSIQASDGHEGNEQDGYFTREMKLLVQLHHQNIVEFIEARHSGVGEYQIFTEFIDGKTVKEILETESGGLSPQRVRRYCHMLCDAINYLHTRQRAVLHCNINGSNVMITNQSDLVKLIDFGIARQLAITGTNDVSKLYTDSHLGEDRFMSPELVPMEKRVFSRESDIWAFGCTLYQMCAGKEPFQEVKTLYMLAKTIQKGAPELPEDRDPLLKEFYSRCTAVERKERSRAADLLRHQYLLQRC